MNLDSKSGRSQTPTKEAGLAGTYSFRRHGGLPRLRMSVRHTQLKEVNMSLKRQMSAVSAVFLIGAPFTATASEAMGVDMQARCDCGDDGDRNVQLQRNGLGDPGLQATPLNEHPDWAVYGFGRDGMEYYQISDRAGKIQLIIGHADGVFWLLPAGDPNVRVILPGDPSAGRSMVLQSEVYRSKRFTLDAYQSGGETVWVVESISDRL